VGKGGNARFQILAASEGLMRAGVPDKGSEKGRGGTKGLSPAGE
jgi:hypothetical protein